MQPRTLYALIAAGLLLFTGSVFAQSETPTATTPEPETTPTATQPTYGAVLLSVSPSVLWLEAGEMARLEVRIDSDADRLFRAYVRPDAGMRASLSATEVRASPEQPASLVLTVRAPFHPGPNGEREFAVMVHIDDGAGNARDQKAIIGLRGPAETTPAEPQPVYSDERPRPVPPQTIHLEPIGPIVIVDPPFPEPARPIAPPRLCHRTPEPIEGAPAEPVLPGFVVVDDFSMTPTERRLSALLERIERRLYNLEQPMHQPRPTLCVIPPPEPVREPASIMLGDREVNVPDEGRRVAVLLDGGDQGGRFHLSVHSRDDGWRYGLEKDGIALGPHQRTFVWLRIAPGDTDTSAYEVVARNGSTSLVAQGSATWAGPQIV